MTVTPERIESAMVMLCAMTVEDIADARGMDIQTVYNEFRRSLTFKMLFDKETGLWENGPTYIAEEYAEIG